MGKTNIPQYKLDKVTRLKEKMQVNDKFIFTDYRGLTVEQITELRTELRKVQAELQVVKNSATKVAFQELEKSVRDDFLFGPTALTYCHNEPGLAAKILFKSSKTTTLNVKGALIDGDVYDAAALEALSRLPGRMELIQMLMGTMQAPASNLVYALNGVATKLVRTLVAVCEQKVRNDEN